MMRLLTFCVLVNSERLLFRKFNFEFKLLLQDIFSLQILNKPCLLYTSDAAGVGVGVDLGGGRIIK